MESDLHHVIRAKILQPVHCEFILHQLLSALMYLHSGGLMHRDVKPQNLLLNSDCHLRLCDFGLCRSIGEAATATAPPPLSDYIATRWYRAPEILLGSTSYGRAVDMWAAGCILAEMVRGRPLFPGSNRNDQLLRVIEVTGLPSESDLVAMRIPPGPSALDELPPTETIAFRTLESACPTASAEALDLIRRALTLDPTMRITAEAALEHPYCRSFMAGKTPMRYPGRLRVPVSDDDKYTATQYRTFLFQVLASSSRPGGPLLDWGPHAPNGSPRSPHSPHSPPRSDRLNASGVDEPNTGSYYPGAGSTLAYGMDLPPAHGHGSGAIVPRDVAAVARPPPSQPRGLETGSSKDAPRPPSAPMAPTPPSGPIPPPTPPPVSAAGVIRPFTPLGPGTGVVSPTFTRHASAMGGLVASAPRTLRPVSSAVSMASAAMTVPYPAGASQGKGPSSPVSRT